jgi:RNA polymerase sigma factor (sigma-70 family)
MKGDQDVNVAHLQYMMENTDAFEELVRRVRQGDAQAAAQLVETYGHVIRVAVRTKLSDPALRRQFDSMDVCQSVLKSFFSRASAGQFDICNPNQLARLFIAMAQNKLAMRARAARRQCRDLRRLTCEARIDVLQARGAEPGLESERRELLDRAMTMLPVEVRQIAIRRSEGEAWEQIACALGGTPEQRRKQYERAIRRVAMKLATD